MRKNKNNSTITTFNRQVREQGLTYAEAQRRETMQQLEKVRAPRGGDGTPVYMKVSARKMLESLEKKEGKGK